MSFPHPSDAEVADIVRGVGRAVLGNGLQSDVQIKRDGSFVTDHDLEVQNRLYTMLREKWPDIPLLGEEMSDSEQHAILAGEERFWCIDPLDGTTNFTSGLPFFGISVALVEQGVSRLGIVYDPNRDECFAASAGGGAFLNGKPLQTQQTARSLQCIACVDFKRLAQTLSEHLVARPPYKSQRNLGACVIEWCWLAANRFQLYLHGGQRIWDYAAGHLIMQEAGGSAVTLDGSPIIGRDQFRNRKISVVAASNPALLDDWLSWIHDRADLYNLLLKTEGAGSSR